jgi:Zn-finger nucleic acid-binding protein
MRSYERNGVTVDQCSECRGIFLDRGELERLVDAESAWQEAPQQQAAQHQPAYGKHPKKRRKSFLDDIFD